MNMGDNLLAETILEMNGCTVEDIGTWQFFYEKKEKVKKLLEECGADNQELNRRMGLIELILSRRQKLQFYLVEKPDHTFGLPENCDLNRPETFETLMLLDELAGTLEEIAEQAVQKNSVMELDDNLMKILGLLNEAPYEKLDQVLDCLLLLTERQSGTENQ
ncbi:MAG: hypothetical protein PUG60_09030 [Lachnospiraceae bacterium]|nr:hypothetical protein [Lachnospiraceae bacterium]MDY4971433.1 hypothetical protein [Lachnospiraceae bacterium]